METIILPGIDGRDTILQKTKDRRATMWAATGHRPEKLTNRKDLQYSKELLEVLITVAQRYFDQYKITQIISGGALGWDQAVAIAAIREKIALTIAVPYEGQESRWPEASQKLYRRILEKATEVITVSTGDYAPLKMQVRNEWMVDRAKDGLLVLWGGSEGGTANTIHYATCKGRWIINVWNNWLETEKGLRKSTITQ